MERADIELCPGPASSVNPCHRLQVAIDCLEGGFDGYLYGQHRNRRNVRMSEVRRCLSLDPRKKFKNTNGAIFLPSTLRSIGSRLVRAVQLYELEETETAAHPD
jgi:hypothetical protein